MDVMSVNPQFTGSPTYFMSANPQFTGALTYFTSADLQFTGAPTYFMSVNPQFTGAPPHYTSAANHLASHYTLTRRMILTNYLGLFNRTTTEIASTALKTSPLAIHPISS